MDKRLLVVEEELAFALDAMRRRASTLSSVIREAWDGRKLATLTKNSPMQATDAHVSIIAQSTATELIEKLEHNELSNGFANRFLFVYTYRTKVVPQPELPPSDVEARIAKRLGQALRSAQSIGQMRFDNKARQEWFRVYPRLSEAKPGTTGAMTARAEAQVLRLACVYAVLDGSQLITVQHLQAALAFWRYCEASVRFVFGEARGNPVANRILQALRKQRVEGISRTEIRDLFQRHQPQDTIDEAITLLETLGLARVEKEPTGGRPATRVCATEATKATNPPDDRDWTAPDPDITSIGSEVAHV